MTRYCAPSTRNVAARSAQACMLASALGGALTEMASLYRPVSGSQAQTEAV